MSLKVVRKVIPVINRGLCVNGADIGITSAHNVNMLV